MLRAPVLAVSLFAAVVESPLTVLDTARSCCFESAQAGSTVSGTWTAEIQPSGWNTRDRKDRDRGPRIERR